MSGSHHHGRYEDSRVLRISLAGMAVTALVQVVIFAISGSVALLADTIHNGADALTALPLAAAFWLGQRPANRRYTYGYGRSEDLAGLSILLVMFLSALLAAWEASSRLIHPAHIHHVWWVVGAGVVGFIGNEAVAGYRIRGGRRIGSAALVADGYHARTDGLSSLAVVVGAVGVAAGWRLADPIVGLAISVLLLVTVWHAARGIYARLMDAVDPGLVAQIDSVLQDVHGIDAVDVVRIRWVGHELHAEAEVRADASLSLVAAHELAHLAEHQLQHEIPRLERAIIHVGPPVIDGVDPHTASAGHREHHHHHD